MNHTTEHRRVPTHYENARLSRLAPEVGHYWRAAFLTTAFILWTFGAAACSFGAQSPSDPKPIAEVGGKPIYERDIAGRVDDQLSQLARQEYELKKKALDSYIDDELLARRAKAEHITPQALLARDVDSKVSKPTDDQLRSFYAAQPGLQSHPFSEIKDKLRDFLYRREVSNAHESYFATLRQEANVEIFLQPPQVQVSYDPRRLRGGAHAPVVIVEFADFQCPFCRGAEPTLRQLLSKYAGQVSLAYRDYPLSEIHPFAEHAAEAARCAEAQGKFWAYHDLLMNNPPHLDNASLLADARTLHLDEHEFETCLSSGQYKAAVGLDRDAGVSLGVQGTPTFFINGKLVSGDQPAAVFEKVIDAQLASSIRTGKAGK